MTAYQQDGDWWLRVEDDRGETMSESVIPWDGEGRFYEEGLNALAVARIIPNGYLYTTWNTNPDGTYTAVLKHHDPRFGG